MTSWIDIAALVFVCVTANHLGLMGAVLERTECPELARKVLQCPKCLSFWVVLVYATCARSGFIFTLAVSFLASYVAIWLELFEGFIDALFNLLYEKIYPTGTDNADTTDADKAHSASPMP
jgi:hypothetical protein